MTAKGPSASAATASVMPPPWLPPATATRLAQALAGLTVAGMSRPLSASFGVVGVGDGEPIMEAFDRADAQLLTAKRERHAGTPAAA